MIHDFMVSENYIVFLIPPAFFKLTDIIFNRGSMADALNYDGASSTRLLILEKKKDGRRWETELPSSMVFHHGNLYEEDGILNFTTCQARNGSLLNHIAEWHEDATRSLSKPNIYQWAFDLKANRVLSKKTLAVGHDFPNFSQAYLGKKAEYLYSAEMGGAKDPMRFKAISKVSIDRGVVAQYLAAANETLGEPVFKSGVAARDEDSGHVFVPGYSAGRDESFLDILEAKTMERVARLWVGAYFPVGFHGNFIEGELS
jgi:carotenoid cleavage dioxygenase-like enzyme